MIESGEKFGKYTLLERLAIGGMAEIFMASAGGLDGFEKIVAIKRLHRQYSEDRDFATMLIDEAKLAVQLSHANIGQVFDLGCIEGQYFIVMEFIDGLDLHDLALRVQERQEVLPVEGVVYVARAVADALHYAHTKVGVDGRSLEVVHRDVSPQNIMVSVDGEVKLVDFGIAKARMRAQHTQAGIIKGKFYYMSPEQGQGYRIDARTDVYALGMVLYEILCGHHPFDHVPDGDLLKSVRRANYPPIAQQRPDLPRGLTEIIDRALARDPDQRYGSALELKRALETFAHRGLPPFGRMELANLARQYRASSVGDGLARSSTEEVMERAQYAASQHSVIFDVAAADVDFEDEQTQVFIRGSDEADFSVDDLESDGETRLLDWVDPADLSSGHLQATPEVDRGGGAPIMEVDRGAAAMSGAPYTGQERDERGVATQFDHLLRGKPHLVGGALAGVAVLLLAAVAAIAFGSGERTEDEEQQRWHASIADEPQLVGDVVDRISLAVSTVPANSALYQDDRFVGNTPSTLKDLEVGASYVLRFEKEDHDTRELNIVVEPDMAPLVVRMEPLGGIIQVEARPEGAQVYLDGELQGSAPVTIMGLERDLSYEVYVRHEDGQEAEATVRWDSGSARLQELRFDFEADREVESDKEVAEASAPPRKVTQRAPRATAPRRKPAARRAPARKAPAPKTQPKLEVAPIGGSGGSASSGTLNVWELGDSVEKGRLNVRGGAEAGRIYVDNKIVHDGSTLMGHSLDVGTYEVKVYYRTLKRYSETQTVTVRAGETSTVSFRP